MSEIILDTITGKSTATTITIGSTPVVSASANSMTIRGEGSNQTSIQQGLAKSWVFYEADNSNAIHDSLNISAIRDNGTGYQGATLATPMGNTDWISHVTGTGASSSSGYGQLDSQSWGGGGTEPYRSTTQVNFRFVNGATAANATPAAFDHNDCNFTCFGDLA